MDKGVIRVFGRLAHLHSLRLCPTELNLQLQTLMPLNEPFMVVQSNGGGIETSNHIYRPLTSLISRLYNLPKIAHSRKSKSICI